MIQDLGAHHLYNQYDPQRRPKPQDRVISYHAGSMLVRIGEDGTLAFPSVSETEGIAEPEDVMEPQDAMEPVYAFSIDEQAFFLTLRELRAEGYSYTSMKDLRTRPLLPRTLVFAAFTAMHLGEWYRRKQYCGACGQKLRVDSTERAMQCPSCGEKYYPRINPAVIVGVKNGDSLLLTKYRQGFGYNALVAGFTEIGETLEETVAREVMEEAGVRVKNIRYYKSQPWGPASDILAGFYCEVDGDDTIRMDDGELKYAEWVPRDEIVLQPTDYSLTNEMMRMLKEGKEPSS